MGGGVLKRRGFASKILAVTATTALPVTTLKPLVSWAEENSHAKKEGHHRFDDIDWWVKVFEDPARDEWQQPEKVLDWIGAIQDQVVVDIGCASGYFTRRFAKRNGNAWAIGAEIESGFFSPIHRLANQAGLCNVMTQLCKPDGPNLPPASVDLCFFCDTWHHISSRIDYLKNLRRSLRPNGRVVIVDLFKERTIHFGPRPSERLHHDEVVAELKEAGFSVRLNTDLLPYQYLVEGRY